MTIEHLRRIFAVLPVAATLSRAIGMERTTLLQRVRRGTPELSDDEAQRIRTVLAEAGLETINVKG
jgi:hypothetical protein